MQPLNKTLQELMQGQNINANIQQTMKQVYADPEVCEFLNANQERLTKQIIVRGESKLYEFFHEKQLIKRGAATVAPGYSPQLTITAGQIDVMYVPTQQLIERQRIPMAASTVSCEAKVRRLNSRAYIMAESMANTP